MAQQNINIGTGELTGDGESLRSAFGKINSNFSELYTDIGRVTDDVFDGDYNNLTNKPDLSQYLTSLNGDHQGSFYSDDSTLVIDGATGNISWDRITDRPLLFSGNYDDLVGKPDLNDYVTVSSITNGTLTVQVENAGDLQGSVFAEDSTLLVDANNATIPAVNLSGSLPAIPADNTTIDGTALKTTINNISAALAVGLS